MVDSLSIAGLKQAIVHHGEAKNKELRNFGFIMATFFGIVLGLLPVLIKKSELRSWTVLAAALFLIPSLLYPRALKWLYQLWMAIGMILGWIQTRIILSIIFYLIVSPIAVFMRLRGKDILNMKWDKSAKTYRNTVDLQSGSKFESMF